MANITSRNFVGSRSIINSVLSKPNAVLIFVFLETEGEGDTEWLRTVLKSGTVTDKMAAMTIRLQRTAFYRLKVKI